MTRTLSAAYSKPLARRPHITKFLATKQTGNQSQAQATTPVSATLQVLFSSMAFDLCAFPQAPARSAGLVNGKCGASCLFSLEALVKPLDATNKNPTLVIPHAATGRMDTASDECLSFVPVRFEIYQISRKGQKHNTFTEMSARRCGLMGANILNFTHSDKLWGLFFALCRRGQPPLSGSGRILRRHQRLFPDAFHRADRLSPACPP